MQELGFKEAFWPLYALDEAEPNTITNIALRAGFAALAAGTFWVLIAYAPDKGILTCRFCVGSLFLPALLLSLRKE